MTTAVSASLFRCAVARSSNCPAALLRGCADEQQGIDSPGHLRGCADAHLVLTGARR